MLWKTPCNLALIFLSPIPPPVFFLFLYCRITNDNAANIQIKGVDEEINQKS